MIGVGAHFKRFRTDIDCALFHCKELRMNREQVGFLFLAAMTALTVIAGFSSVVKFDCGIGCNFSAPNEPYFVLFGILIGAFSVWFPQLEPVKRADQSVALWRRSIALLVDLHVGITACVTVSLLASQIGVFALTGVWSWSEVDPSSPVVATVNGIGLLIAFTLLYCYFWLPSKNNRATVGQYIMGFQVVSDGSAPKFGMRPLWGYFALASLFIWIWFGARDGRYWWDLATSTKPIMVSA